MHMLPPSSEGGFVSNHLVSPAPFDGPGIKRVSPKWRDIEDGYLANNHEARAASGILKIHAYLRFCGVRFTGLTDFPGSHSRKVRPSYLVLEIAR